MFFRPHKPIGYTTIFLLVCLVIIQLSGPFVGEGDPLYHFRFASLFKSGLTNFKTFEWLPFTTVGKSGADLWWGYHILLSPFATIFHGVLGIKLATLFFSGLFLIVFALLLNGMKIKWVSAWLVLLVLGSGDFL